MSDDRDRLPSFVTNALDSLDHYIQYPGRSAKDLVIIIRELEKLDRASSFRLGGEFSEEAEKAWRLYRRNQDGQKNY